MACAVIFYLLLEQKKSYEIPKNTNEYSACFRSMHCRYLKRIFIMGKYSVYSNSMDKSFFSILVQWLSTLSKIQHDDMQKNFERYVSSNSNLDFIFSIRNYFRSEILLINYFHLFLYKIKSIILSIHIYFEMMIMI